MKNIPSYNDVAITIRWLVTHKNQCEHVSSEWNNIIHVIDYLSALSPKKVVSALRQAETELPSLKKMDAECNRDEA